ncbi:hypothetical protein WICPIJ_003983 [Wickerhamomyces pijperi]|uniref:1-phosphatidylinositol 4-phosphate kinase n=1 Tax=Wickerhamomyces pijperi TaxID=599730 RepID=A0A9P8Q6S5_WICPI|nr:hypothetical protein WICPIJ_003983 [Wickerhamomyces pijperi]
MPPITCHILDTTRGKPASDVIVAIFKIGELVKSDSDDIVLSESNEPFGISKTNSDGRITNWNFNPTHELTELGIKDKEWELLKPGYYKIRFQTGQYFKRLATNETEGRTFFPFVEIMFTVEDPADKHYHIPLLLANHSYSTYRENIPSQPTPAQIKKQSIRELIQHENKSNEKLIHDPSQSPSPLNKDQQLYSSSNLISRVATTDDSMIFTNPSSSSSESQNTSTEQANNIDTTLANTTVDSAQNSQQEQLPVVTDINTAETIIIPSEVQQNNADTTPGLTENEEFFDALNKFTFKERSQEGEAQGQEQANNDQLSEHGSYLQDESQDHVLLNTYVKRRSNSARTTTSITTNIDPTTGEAFTTAHESTDPVLVRRSRTSIGSKNIDIATLEIERMRTSVLSKREKKKQEQKSTDDNNRLNFGNEVAEGHANFVVAYIMLSGIRTSVSRCSGIMVPLIESDFTDSKKLSFDVNGTELTPSSRYAFKFKDYSPLVFRELRQLFGLDPADYLMSLTSEYVLSELTSPGKSGSFFYYSKDHRFIIKTIHRAEHVKLRRILKHYHAHVKQNPNTMISQFYGLHRVKMPLSYGKGRRIYFIIMNNLFPPQIQFQKKFDLKGSTMGRYTNAPPNEGRTIFKDLNWMHEMQTIKFGPKLTEVFLDQLRKDVKLLVKLNIMDYSFLIGLHDSSTGNNDETVRQKKLSVFSPASSNLQDLKNTSPKLLTGLGDLPNLEDSRRTGNIFYTNNGGIESQTTNGVPLDQVYYFGIIDCLTNYSCKKKLETVWRSIGNERSKISALPPKEYGERFLRSIRRLNQTAGHLLSIRSNYHSLETGSKYTPTYTNHLILANGQIGSYFHDIPLNLTSTSPNSFSCSAVIEIPRYSNAKFEINKKQPFNPITQDIKKGKPRFMKNLFPYKGYLTNYGSIPQTWDDPTTKDPETGLFGDNDPLDIVEIGSAVAKVGDVNEVKILGALALIDDGELDWKIIGINVNDEMSLKLNDIEDIEVVCPGLLTGIKQWFKDYKIPDGKPANEFAFGGEFLGRDKAVQVIKHSHDYWRNLIQGGVTGDKIPNCANATIIGSEGYVQEAVSVEQIVKANGKKEEDAAIPAEVGDDVRQPDNAQDWDAVLLGDDLGGGVNRINGSLLSVQGNDSTNNGTLFGTNDLEGLVDGSPGGHDVVDDEDSLALQVGTNNRTTLTVVFLLFSVERVRDTGIFVTANLSQLGSSDGG